MSHFFLSPDDLPPQMPVDDALQRKLDKVAAQYFYDACDRYTQTILSKCGWYLTTCGTALTLIVICAARRDNWEILKVLPSLAKYLGEFAPKNQIRIYPPPGEGTSLNLKFQQSIVRS